jgi:hypothetical protein
MLDSAGGLWYTGVGFHDRVQQDEEGDRAPDPTAVRRRATLPGTGRRPAHLLRSARVAVRRQAQLPGVGLAQHTPPRPHLPRTRPRHQGVEAGVRLICVEGRIAQY